MSDKFSLYQTDGLWGIIENASNEKQISIKSYFGSDLIIKRLNEQADQIDQLKQQLAEKDKEINSLIVDYEKRISQEQELMSNMEHRLTEKQNTIDEINREFVQAVHDWKTLCAEKDKEIETMKKDSDKNIDYLVEFASLIENEKDCNRMLKALDRVKSGNKYIIDKANQSKTEFAIQELEKVKEWLITESKRYPIVYDITDNLVGGAIDKDKTFEIIDNQINELKKG